MPAPNSGFPAIAAGSNHGLGLKANGSIVAWVRNVERQCTLPSKIPNKDFTAVAAGFQPSTLSEILNRMKRYQAIRLVIILFLVGWAVYEMIPPTGRDLLQEFERRADRGRRDATFSNIVARARALEKAMPVRAYASLKEKPYYNEVIQSVLSASKGSSR